MHQNSILGVGDAMKLSTKALSPASTALYFSKASNLVPYTKRVPQFLATSVKFPGSRSTCCSCTHSKLSSPRTSSHGIAPDISSDMFQRSGDHLEALEENVEKVIYRCRFLAILAVFGSLIGSLLCFVKGCAYIGASFQEYFINRGKVILLLVEAVDIYLLGTVMLVFGMGLYELFISNLDKSKLASGGRSLYRSDFFGLFTLKERPRWLEISTVNELKTKLGHVIVMLLLIGLFEKSKKAVIQTPTDLLCFSASILLSSGCLYLLSKLKD